MNYQSATNIAANARMSPVENRREFERRRRNEPIASARRTFSIRDAIPGAILFAIGLAAFVTAVMAMGAGR